MVRRNHGSDARGPGADVHPADVKARLDLHLRRPGDLKETEGPLREIVQLDATVLDVHPEIGRGRRNRNPTG